MPLIEYIGVEEELAISEPLALNDLFEILENSANVTKMKQRFCNRDIFKRLFKQVKNVKEARDS